MKAPTFMKVPMFTKVPTLILILIIAFMFAFVSCNNTQNRTNENATDGSIDTELTEVVYTCPMHPEVISNDPGECPKCGMDLVKTEDLKHGHGADSSLDTLNL